jgi:hypothetical protein
LAREESRQLQGPGIEKALASLDERSRKIKLQHFVGVLYFVVS